MGKLDALTNEEFDERYGHWSVGLMASELMRLRDGVPGALLRGDPYSKHIHSRLNGAIGTLSKYDSNVNLGKLREGDELLYVGLRTSVLQAILWFEEF